MVMQLYRKHEQERASQQQSPIHQANSPVEAREQTDAILKDTSDVVQEQVVEAELEDVDRVAPEAA